MSLPALPDGIPVFLFPLLVSELFCLPPLSLAHTCLLALLTGRSRQVVAGNDSLGPFASFSVNGLLAYLSVMNLRPPSAPLPLSPMPLASLVTLFKKLCFALRLRILMSFRLLRFFNFILKYHLFFFLSHCKRT